jgi:hypothetical protein
MCAYALVAVATPAVVAACLSGLADDVAQGPLPDEMSKQVLNNSAWYPLQWVLIAEATRSQLNTELPLLTAAGTWFDD